MGILSRTFDRIQKTYDQVSTPRSNTITNSQKYDLIMNAISKINERTIKMAMSLDKLASEIDRANAASSEAITFIEKLSFDMRTITDELAAARDAAAANAVDATMLDELISKLKQSTDALQSAQVKK